MPFRRSEAGPREWIDRSRTLSFTFEGRPCTAHPGDTITSALLASGVSLLGRSFKYHRPRGAVSLANHDVNALFATDADTNVRGDVTPVTDGMVADPVNVRGSLEKDADRHMDRFGRFLPVGFYYKAFHRPRALFPFWERIIRRRAGLGRVDTAWTPRRRAKRYGYCDVLVIGAGPAGLRAALDAADAGFDVLLADENPRIGGSLDYQWLGDAIADTQRDDLVARVLGHPGVTVQTSTVALGSYTDHWIPLAAPEGIIKVRARGVVLATGVLEQPAVFHNNDLPGVMLASGAQRLLHRFGVLPFERAVVQAANGEGLVAAEQMAAAGVTVAAVVAHGPGVTEADARRLTDAGIPVYRGWTVYAAHGSDAVSGVTIAPVDEAGNCDADSGETIHCDGVLMSVGWAPAGHLLYQSGGTFRYDDTLAMPVPADWPSTVVPAGRVNGAFTLGQQLADAGDAVRRLTAALRGEPVPPVVPQRDTVPHGSQWPIVPHPKDRNFVDFDEDLQLKDLEQAAREGFDNIELLKRFSTVGMGPSQGKHANLNAIRILARLRDQGIDATGTTTARPMYYPVRLEDLAGRRMRPERETPMQDWHRERGATFMEAGEWRRPAYYGADAASAIADEVAMVRNGVGLIDVSTLGKLEVFGPDAATLLDGAYTMRKGNIRLGLTRYALMVDDAGIIVDDGVAGRLADDHFYLSATSGHAEATYQTLTRKALEWGLDVHVVNRTGQLGALNVVGPMSRRVLEPLVDMDLSEASLPRLGICDTRVCGHWARLVRVGFVGELGYEIHATPAALTTIWHALLDAGAAHGIRPFGVEAQRVLRLEKGHIIVGQDTDGLTNPFEAAMPWAVHLKKPFFIGRPALAHLKGQEQRRLVRFVLPPDHAGPLPRECHLVIRNGDIAGRVTSIARSPTRGQPIGLAMVDRALADSDEPLTIRADDDVLVRGEMIAETFYDPDGVRQDADNPEATP
ncbi:2Fe-2S iron-sulfur cluster-binding protein [Aquisalimonas sp.]|uniref:2Fe-2S iron-sulfur cluster-binding protein n=1 Tax=Aquisalimonas sp. TaxID=1872621 RepID=UPI0025C130CF|nr:2Fe-2S iron-sulfur cluster-binding protein [Aquisalimonas sp.]